ncbi:hypothetical protein BC938DRAFT_483272 [Jimgerdemannia flammicorona]|uniref:Methionine synthase reductase n=1 Tax=Jimgerdemannia flammicorona TaxID=994334 RepID=A0A433QCB2_9FUNG|nr:hypothetical protein BC938DRAFT_483272 [Jimgerdemannia flammicorona]
MTKNIHLYHTNSPPAHMVISTTQEKSDDFVVLYASQTGNAEWIAKNILQEAKERGHNGEVYVLNDFEKVSLPDLRTIIFVTSNTGDGDPPDNSSKFWKHLRRNKQKDLFARARFTILGLGDTNYSNFNNTAKKLERKVKELGGTVFYEKGLADDAQGLEAVVDPWISNLWPKLADVCVQHTKPPTTAEPTVTLVADQLKSLSVAAKPDPDLPEALAKYLDLPNFLVDHRSDTEKAAALAATTPRAAKHKQPVESAPVDRYSRKNRRNEIPPEVEKYLDLPNSLVTRNKDAASAAALPTGHRIHVDTTALHAAKELTALPRVPGVVCRLVHVSNAPAPAPSTSVPSFVQAPSPIVYTTIRKARCLTTPDAVKRTLLIELEVPRGEEVLFEPGDAFGVLAPNEEGIVRAVVRRLGMSEKEAGEFVYRVEAEMEGVELPSHLQRAKAVTVLDLLRYGVDLTTPPRKAMLRILAEYTSDAEEKKLLLFLCSKQGTAQFIFLRDQSPTLLDILTTFPTCHPPFQRLLDTLPAHQPRSYSVVNSPLAHPNSLHFAFNVLRYTTAAPFNVQRQGVATPWLDRVAGFPSARGITQTRAKEVELGAKVKVPITIRHNAHAFVLPLDTTKPLILIGPGTGVAPFIGFLQHREHQRRIRMSLGGVTAFPDRDARDGFGDVYLFYGCRERNKDWLFREEMEAFVESGVVKVLEVVASREVATGEEVEGRKKEKYVQDAIRRRGAEVWGLVQGKGGDTKGMARDVHDALTDIVCEHGGQTREEATKMLTGWMERRRYLRDLTAQA